MTENNSITSTIKMGNFVKKVGIQGAREQAKERMKEIDPQACVNRYSIGFDDSGSMSGEPIKDAKKAISAFLSACNPTETSVAIHTYSLNTKPLTVDYNLVNVYVAGLKADASTPLWSVLGDMLATNITRGILFSDGSPTDHEGDEIELAREKKIPVDTVYIGFGESPILKSIAERTGGIYLRFDDTTTFAKQMKYLSPKYVALLANAEIKAKVEKGETI